MPTQHRGPRSYDRCLHAMYNSLTAQTLHYFSRPHEAVRRAPIVGPAAWRGSDLAASTAWRHRLSSDDVAEIDRDYARAPAFEPAERAVLEAYDAIASRPELHLDLELTSGDVQLLSNHTILHARTAYEDHDDPARKRHLLRLWVSLDAPRRLRDRIGRARGAAHLVAALVRARIDRAVRGRSPRHPARA